MGKPKHITGYATRYERGTAIIFCWSRDYGYDQVARIEDLDKRLESKTNPPTEYSDAAIIITYTGITQEETIKTFRIHFESGDFEDIDVLLPGYNAGFEDNPAYDVERKVYGPGALFDYRIVGVNGNTSEAPTITYAALPQKDPAKVFGYEKVWTTKETGVVVDFHGSSIARKWEANNYIGGLPKEGVSGIQHVSFAAVNDDTLTSPADVWEAALDPETKTPVVIGFVWAKDLPTISDNEIRVFQVCNDPTSPSYYRTTGLDVEGDVIPAEYLTGTDIAVFQDCPCSVGCDKFQSVMSVTPVRIDSLGKIEIGVYGNAASPYAPARDRLSAYDAEKLPTYPALNTSQFQYDLIVPAGVTYEGVITSGVVNDTSWNFTDIPAGRSIWKVQVTDIATGCVTEYSATVWDDNTRTAGTCDEVGSINFDPLSTLPCEDCCLSCKPGYLTRGGIPLGQNLILNSGSSIVQPTTGTSNDGTITFFGSVNTGVDAILESYLSGTYDISLYNVTGSGAPMGTLIDSDAAITSPTYTFPGLAEGWYGVQIFSTGLLCVSTYYFQIVAPAATRNECEPIISWNIDACSGQVSASVSSESVIDNFLYGVDGVLQGNFPPTVSAGQVVSVHVFYNEEENCNSDVESYQVTEADLQCQEEEAPAVHGCMDEGAVNYNPAATISDGSCFYGVPGCLDPTASNFNPNATIDSGECTYGISGCMDPTATNYNPVATIDDGSCYDACQNLIFSYAEYSVPNQTIGITFVNEPSNYTVTWTEQITGTTFTTTNTGTSPTVIDGVWLITLVDHNGCTQNYVLGVNTDVVFGCMDTHANNFSPAANIDLAYYDFNTYPNAEVLDACDYSIEPSPCIPNELDSMLSGLDKCIANKMTQFTNLLKAGRLKECNTKGIRVVALVRYLLGQRGLPCLYNCADSLSPSLDALTCEERWVNAGSLYWNAATTYPQGTVVNYKGTLFVTTANVIGDQPASVVGQSSWELCTDPNLVFTDNTNRLDKYLAFLVAECKDCGLPPVTPLPEGPVNTPSEEPDTMNGQPLNMNGSVKL